ncbi:uncharacterized protein N7446_013882 [Penicillium canescens]|uniref:Uncharacterized protein n=1 Tax=Penicillium canescens TaxID=5083 RepID=A0AAD6N2H5_PENCN|nr:uncharacterized protein N7446_013882 [Penicillium canescens]KAJ6023517.1 hypothetical protein N7460_013912 [Penicillium canescens]KAJ6042816.1 hypothetical protein N7446_013882 [Penicillium canescens]
MGQPLSNLRRRRSARTLRGFAAHPTPSAPPNLSRETLINALQTVAAYITSKNQDITLIVVGQVPLEGNQTSIQKETAFSGKDGSTTIPFYSFSRLTILAAPWEYLFCAKVHRLSGSGISTVQLYNQDDAVHYLERYLSQHPTASVTQVTVRAWFAQYLLHWTTETELLLLAVNSTYKITSNAQHDPINLNN